MYNYAGYVFVYVTTNVQKSQKYWIPWSQCYQLVCHLTWVLEIQFRLSSGAVCGLNC